MKKLATAGTPNSPQAGENTLAPGASLDLALPPALLAQDNELSHALKALEEILQALETNDPEIRGLSEPLRRAVTQAVLQSLLDRELRSLALRDDLTGLYNRRAFLALATQQIRAATRKHEPLLLFFADVNGLKEINDTFGHSEGDLAIARAATALDKTFRKSDTIARLGGDEFAVLAPETSHRFQELILRRLAKHIRESNQVDDLTCELSLSIGVARFDWKNPATLAELIEQADRSMYRQKKAFVARRSQAAAAGDGGKRHFARHFSRHFAPPMIGNAGP